VLAPACRLLADSALPLPGEHAETKKKIDNNAPKAANNTANPVTTCFISFDRHQTSEFLHVRNLILASSQPETGYAGTMMSTAPFPSDCGAEANFRRMWRFRQGLLQRIAETDESL